MATTADQNLNLTATNFTNTGTVNDHNPSGWSTAGTYHHSSGSSITMNGLVAGRAGRLVGMTLQNGVSGAFTWTAENGGSAAANRFAQAATAPKLLWYDPAGQRWRKIGRAT